MQKKCKYLPRVAFWLVPQNHQRKEIQSLIVKLAERYSAPVFVPHVTVYSRWRTPQQLELTSTVALAGRSPAVIMTLAGLASKNQVTQSLFIKFHADPAIRRFYKAFQTVDMPLAEHQMEPHLSLLYQILPSSHRDALVREISFAWQEIVFDELWAMAIPEKLRTLDDFNCWQPLLICRLASARNVDTIDATE